MILIMLLLITLPLMAEEWQAVPGEDNAVLTQVSEVDALVGLPDT